MFENVDGRTMDGRTDDDDRVISILIAHLGAFGLGELNDEKKYLAFKLSDVVSIMLINVKMPTIAVGIITFISMISCSVSELSMKKVL